MKERTKCSTALPKTNSGRRVIGSRLIRSGTLAGANYRAACRGRSQAEFIAKLGNFEEEADEPAFWLELLMENGLIPESGAMALCLDATELTAIMAASRKTTSGR